MADFSGKEPDFTGKKILVAEDDEINFLLIEILLKKTGANILHAWNGAQVLDIMQCQVDISLILMDIKMPVMDGFDAIKQVMNINPHMKIIAQTAYALGEDKYKCFEAGCVDYIAKPIQMNKLYEMLSKHL